jgi:repressor LexA
MARPRSQSDLTDRQHAILAYIHQAIGENGYPPTLREIGGHFGIRSTNGVNDHLKALVRKGFLERGDKMSRALVPTEKAQDLLGTGTGARSNVVPALMPQTALVEVPVLGRVAAGEPILAEENVTDTVQVDSFLLGGTSKRVFALRVTGESMIEDGIFDGDYIFVKKQLNAEKGEIVVAMIEGEATVKRYYPEGDRIRFQPANAAMAPIYVHKSEFRNTQILGVVVGVYRRM